MLYLIPLSLVRRQTVEMRDIEKISYKDFQNLVRREVRGSAKQYVKYKQYVKDSYSGCPTI